MIAVLVNCGEMLCYFSTRLNRYEANKLSDQPLSQWARIYEDPNFVFDLHVLLTAIYAESEERLACQEPANAAPLNDQSKGFGAHTTYPLSHQSQTQPADLI